MWMIEVTWKIVNKRLISIYFAFLNLRGWCFYMDAKWWKCSKRCTSCCFALVMITSNLLVKTREVAFIFLLDKCLSLHKTKSIPKLMMHIRYRCFSCERFVRVWVCVSERRAAQALHCAPGWAWMSETRCRLWCLCPYSEPCLEAGDHPLSLTLIWNITICDHSHSSTHWSLCQPALSYDEALCNGASGSL